MAGVIALSRQLAGTGRLALIGGGEFSFGETADADRLWTGLADAGRVGFLPTASGSADYGQHFASYLGEGCDREVETIPVYRPRDARRQRNVDRIAACAAVYIGGGIGDEMVGTLRDSSALEAIEERLRSGGTIVMIAAAAQAAGSSMRSLAGRDVVAGFGWVEAAAIEANFLPTHDRRLRGLMQQPGIRIGLGLPAGSCLVVSGDGRTELHGPAFVLEGHDADLKMLDARSAVAESGVGE